MPVFRLGDKTPRIAATAWLAEDAVVIGDVTLEEDVSIWWKAVLRGDNDPITIGAGSNIQDGCVLHTDEGIPLVVGREVTVGHNVILHGCSIGDQCLIGMGSIILNGAVIGANALVGAGALIPEGKTIPPRVLVVGSPARIVRDLTEEEVARIAASARHYREHVADYRRSLVAVCGSSTNTSPSLIKPSS